MQGVFADLFVVKGTKIGHEKVSVHLLEAPLTHIADEIVLTVAEAMSLEPRSPVFVLMGASFGYTLKVIRGNVPQGLSAFWRLTCYLAMFELFNNLVCLKLSFFYTCNCSSSVTCYVMLPSSLVLDWSIVYFICSRASTIITS